MKPKIKKIQLDAKTVEKVNEIINGDYCDHSKHTKLRQIGKAICLSCGDIATEQLIYQIGDKEQRAQRIEHYCSGVQSERPGIFSYQTGNRLTNNNA